MAKAIPFHEAHSRVLGCTVPDLATECVPLDAAHGRFLAAPVLADGPWPATDRSAMDGFAVGCGAEGLPAGTGLPVVGESLAGAPFPRRLGTGEAIRIMTGAVVPAGAAAVVPVEQTSGFAGERVTLMAPVRRGQHIRPMGSEVRPGQLLLAPGRRLFAAEIGALAVLGCVQVPVRRLVQVAIVATGDEVVPVGAAPAPHQVRESNSWALAAQVRETGAAPARLGIARDEPEALRALLQQGLEHADVLITIGGVSKGTHDLVHGTLESLSVRTVFHGIELKPGKPTFFGIRERASGCQFVFGLPGNPASAFTVFDLLVRPLLLRLVGADPGQPGAMAPASGAPWHPNSRLQALPATLAKGPDGRLACELAPTSPSGDPFSLLRGAVYALIPAHAAPADGAMVAVAGGSRGVVLP